ncbi:MAG: hypothetical protein ABGW95_00250, partial [Candidatus Poseidoniia archaeon]
SGSVSPSYADLDGAATVNTDPLDGAMTVTKNELDLDGLVEVTKQKYKLPKQRGSECPSE